ncbi:MAG TPA: phosphotransferase [Planctomycetota bacterium]|nr:phosphotransferase [Planctomycetota bacterium]
MTTIARSGDKPLACERSAWLPSEASSRRYARLTRLQHYPLETAVVMVFAKGTAPAEVARVERATRLLAAAGVPVPAIHDSDPAHLWILQEDLGDESLATAAARGADLADLHARAVALLPPLAALGALETSPQPPLDERRLQRELDQFIAAALLLDGPPGPRLVEDMAALVALCAALPRVLCHRDFHARNLMWHGGRVRVVDHQDALPGPEPYDRVSLAYDPYVVRPDAERDALAGDAPGTAAVAVQRLVKAIGTFASKAAEGGPSSAGPWRQWIAPAARQARRLIRRGELRLPVLDAALGPLAVSAP